MNFLIFAQWVAPPTLGNPGPCRCVSGPALTLALTWTQTWLMTACVPIGFGMAWYIVTLVVDADTDFRESRDITPRDCVSYLWVMFFAPGSVITADWAVRAWPNSRLPLIGWALVMIFLLLSSRFVIVQRMRRLPTANPGRQNAKSTR